jgi:hypothetical protein
MQSDTWGGPCSAQDPSQPWAQGAFPCWAGSWSPLPLPCCRPEETSEQRQDTTFSRPRVGTQRKCLHSPAHKHGARCSPARQLQVPVQWAVGADRGVSLPSIPASLSAPCPQSSPEAQGPAPTMPPEQEDWQPSEPSRKVYAFSK